MVINLTGFMWINQMAEARHQMWQNITQVEETCFQIILLLHLLVGLILRDLKPWVVGKKRICNTSCQKEKGIRNNVQVIVAKHSTVALKF